MNFKQLIVCYTLFIVLLAAPPAVLQATMHGAWLFKQFWALFAGVGVLTFALIASVIYAGKINTQFYAPAFLAGTTFKMLTCLTLILIIIKRNPVDKVVLLVDFAYIYFLNTAFEVYGLLINLRNQNLR